MRNTDMILKKLLQKIAEQYDREDPKEAADFLMHHEWEEIKRRMEFYHEFASLLPPNQLDLQAVKASIDSKGSILLGGHSSLRAQVNHFIASQDDAQKLLNELIGDGNKAPRADTIDTFIKQSIDLSFHKKKDGRPDAASAALFASVLLSAVFPDDFVDFRHGRWKKFADKFELDQVPELESYGKRLIWAGRIARQFAGSYTFRRYFGAEKPNWIVAGLAYLFGKEETLKGLVDEVRLQINTLERGGFSMEVTREMIWNVLENHNPQVILQGPPGSGKTYMAEQVIKYVAGLDYIDDYRLTKPQSRTFEENSPVIWDIVQFHPSYSYEDFVRGVVTVPVEKGIVFQTKNRILAEAAKAAEKHPNIPVILILDEINRADLARVLGELIYAMERRDQPVASQYEIGDPPDRTLQLPRNLYFIGTMNTADRSIALVDYAIRRRFSFFYILPSVQVIEEFYNNREAHDGDEAVSKQLAPRVAALYRSVSELFDGLRDADDIRIGHSYFLVKGTRDEKRLSRKEWAAALAFRFAFEVMPMLTEYRKERRLRDAVEEIEVDGQRFSLYLADQTLTRHEVENWLSLE